MPEIDPLRFIAPEVTEAQRDALPDIPGMIVFNGDAKRLEMLLGSGEWSALRTDEDYMDEFDAFIDDTYIGANPNIYGQIQTAVDDGAVSIFVKSAGDETAITVASGDSAQRIQGKDADTTTVPQNITCQRADLTLEQLALSNKTVTIDAAGVTLANCYATGTGAVVVTSANGVNHSIRNFRAVSCTGVPLTIACGGVVDHARFNGCSGDHLIDLGSSPTELRLLNIRGSGGSADYAINQTAGIFAYGILSNLHLRGNLANGGVNLVGYNTVISDSVIETTSNLGAAARLLRLTDSGAAVNTLVSNVELIAKQAADVLFEYAGLDANGNGLVLHNVQAGNDLLGGTVLGSQDAVWLGCCFRNCTINFQSKTGMVVKGGDMTGATLQNIPSDIIFRGVKGQLDRGETKAKARVYNDPGPQAIPNATWTAVTFDHERYDNDGMHSTVANTSRLTAVRAGHYHIHGQIKIHEHATGVRILRILLNGTTPIAFVGPENGSAFAGVGNNMEISTDWDMAAADYVEIQVYQNSGGALNVESTQPGSHWSPEFMMQDIG